MHVVWTDSALLDLADAYRYIALDNPQTAARVIAQLRQSTIEKLTAFPEIGRPGRVKGSRELVLRPFVIAYRVRGETIEMLRVLHGRRRWPERVGD